MAVSVTCLKPSDGGGESKGSIVQMGRSSQIMEKMATTNARVLLIPMEVRRERIRGSKESPYVKERER